MVLAAGLYEWLLLIHILAAMVWLGGLIVLDVLAALVFAAASLARSAASSPTSACSAP